MTLTINTLWHTINLKTLSEVHKRCNEEHYLGRQTDVVGRDMYRQKDAETDTYTDTEERRSTQTDIHKQKDR